MTAPRPTPSKTRERAESAKCAVFWTRYGSSFSARRVSSNSVIPQIQPDMIALDPEFVGSMAPPSKLTEGDVPFARLPRLERLRIEGKADETEVADAAAEEDDPANDGSNGAVSKAEKEKMKMRGKGKSLKRSVKLYRFSNISPMRLTSLAHIQVPSEEEEERDRSFRRMFHPCMLYIRPILTCIFHFSLTGCDACETGKAEGRTTESQDCDAGSNGGATAVCFGSVRAVCIILTYALDEVDNKSFRDVKYRGS